MDTNQLYALIEAAEVQQKAVDAAVAQLKLEREALARERKALAREVREAVDGAVTGAMSDASATASRVVGQALDPAAARLSSLISRADGASQRLEGAASGLRWKWVTMLAAGTVCTVLAVAAFGFLWSSWLGDEIGWRRAEVAQLKASAEDFERRAGKADLQQCGGEGEKKRLCVRVDRRYAYGAEGDYFVIRGY